MAIGEPRTQRPKSGFLTQATFLRLLLFTAVVFGVGWGILGIGPENITPERVRGFVLSFGLWAPAILFLTYSQPFVPLPASVMTVTSGLAFGPLLGCIVALSGALTRACTQFVVARYLGRKTVTKLLHGRIAHFNQKLGKHSFKAVLLIRMIPNVPYDMQNYGLGVSHVRFIPYLLATILGIAPFSIMLVLFGHSLTEPQQFWKLLAVLLTIAVFVILQQWYANRHAVPTARPPKK